MKFIPFLTSTTNIAVATETFAPAEASPFPDCQLTGFVWSMLPNGGMTPAATDSIVDAEATPAKDSAMTEPPADGSGETFPVKEMQPSAAEVAISAEESAPAVEVQIEQADAEPTEAEGEKQKSKKNPSGRKKSEPKTGLSPYEIYTREKMKAALLPICEMGGRKPGDVFLDGAVAFYAPARIMTIDEIKAQFDTPDDVSEKLEGWHAMHYCLACLAGEDLMQYVQKVMATYSARDWVELNKPARGSVGLLHALAMNNDHESALKAFLELNSMRDMHWSCTGGILGLLPTHVAVINGAYRLAEAMEPLCAGANGRELLTCFPVSSQTLKQILTGTSRLNLNMLQLRSSEKARECSRDLRGKGLSCMWKTEIREGKHLQQALTRMPFRADTTLKEVTKENRLSGRWLSGLLSAMKPITFTWTDLHCEVMNPECTRAQLESNRERNRELLSCKDAHGRSPLFYALACGSAEAIRWCLDNSPSESLQECDTHQRSLLTALTMNPNGEQMLDLVGELITERNTREDIFGISPMVYAMTCKKNELAKRIYEHMRRLYPLSPSCQKALRRKFRRAAASLKNEEMQDYLSKNDLEPFRQEWAAFGCFY